MITIFLLSFISLSAYAVSEVSNLAEEVVRLALSQINKTKGDGEFSGLIWADEDVTYCERFVSAVITVASGKNISEQKVRYLTADVDRKTRFNFPFEGGYINLLKESRKPPKGAVCYLSVYYLRNERKGFRDILTNCYGGFVGISDGEGNVIGALNASQGVGVLSEAIKKSCPSGECGFEGWVFPDEWNTPTVLPPIIGKDLPKTFSSKGVSIMLISVESFPPLKEPDPYNYQSETPIIIKITNNTYNNIYLDLGDTRIFVQGEEFRRKSYYGPSEVKPGHTRQANMSFYLGIPANTKKITIYIPYHILRPSPEELEAVFEVELY